MSPPSLTNSSNSKLNQFGLYRTIDERTEEFLKLSRKRQMRQGCVCAAISTAITVTIVVVILLIYEYSIIVESSLVQRRRGLHKYNDTVVINDTPVADRLDRSYFGFDQDYFEQMPLLVNALQESTYIDPSIEIPLNSKDRDRKLKYSSFTTEPTSQTSYRNNIIRRTSPRPFIFEYRSPTPVPFHKNYNSRSWIESYRNAQRLKNLEQVISYLEKTINAKFGDLYTKPTTAQIAFSGVYVKPTINEVAHERPSSLRDLLTQDSIKTESIKKHTFNHQSDPYFNFKPESPGDVNLLADVPLKFSPSNHVPSYNLLSKPTYKIPMFRPIARLKGCDGPKCRKHSNDEKYIHIIHGAAEMNSSENMFSDKPNTLNVLLNLFSMTPAPNNYHKKQDLTTHRPFDKIYITTPNPHIQFRRKSTSATTRSKGYVRRYKRPPKPENKFTKVDSQSLENHSSNDNKANMLLHFNFSPKDGNTPVKATNAPFTPSVEVTRLTTTENVEETPFIPTHAPFIPTPPPYVPTCPGELCSTHVEDFHVGSSGVIPIELRTHPTTTLPKATTTQSLFDTSMKSFEEPKTWSTSPPEILKFSKEDAKIPDEYRYFGETQEENHSTVTRRSFQDDEYYIGQSEEENTESIGTRNSYLNDNMKTTLMRQSISDHFGNFKDFDEEIQSSATKKAKNEVTQPTVTKGYHADNTQSPVTVNSISEEEEITQITFAKGNFEDSTQLPIKQQNLSSSEKSFSYSFDTEVYQTDKAQLPVTEQRFETSRQTEKENPSRKHYKDDEYDNYRTVKEMTTQIPVSRTYHYADNAQTPVTSQGLAEHLNESYEEDADRRTLIVKLKNYLQDTTNEPEQITEGFIDMFSIEETNSEVPDITTIKTYVPQINGHYRSVNQNSRNINVWLNGTPESERKRRLQITSVTAIKKPTPSYVEIRRNKTSIYKHKGLERE